MYMNLSKVIKTTDTTVENVTPWFLWTFFGMHIALFLTVMGVVYIDASYIEFLGKLIRYFICAFLVIRFHPFRKHELHKYDGQIIFLSAMFLLTSEGLTAYILETVKDRLHK